MLNTGILLPSELISKIAIVSRDEISSRVAKESNVLVLRYKNIFHAKIFEVYDYLNNMLVTSYEEELKFCLH